MRQPMHGTSSPKSQLKSTRLTAKFGSFLDHAKMGEKGQNVISSFVQFPISLIFALHVFFIIHLPMMRILLTKPMQKSVNTGCLHCNFARLKYKHIGVLGTNVATISWLHWSPVSGYSYKCACAFHTAYAWQSFLVNKFVGFPDVRVKIIKISSSWWWCLEFATSPIGWYWRST